MSRPRVSVVCTAYNVAPYVGAAIESALAQDYEGELEVVVVDDGSTDGTATVLERFAGRVTLVSKPNGGFIAAVNSGLERVTGDYVGLLDGDDVWPLDRIRRQVDYLEANPAVGLVHGDMDLIDADGRPLAPSFFALQGIERREGDVFGPLLHGNFVSGGASLFRASLLDRIAPIPPDAAWPDWWIATRVAEVARIGLVEGSCNRYRQHGANMGLGAGGATRALRREEEIRFRRFILRELAQSRASLHDLATCLAALESHAVEIGTVRGVAHTTVVPATAEDRSAADAAYEEGIARGAEGDLEAAARDYLRALGHDPWHGRARAELQVALPALGGRVVRVRPLASSSELVSGAAVEEPLVTIVIPTYGKLDLTRQCIDALEHTGGSVAFEIVVVDNASPDETPAWLREQAAAGRLTAILNLDNRGFGEANRQGAEVARAPFVLFLNNDTIPQPGWLEALVAAASEPGVGVVGSRLLYANDTIQHAGIALDENGIPFHPHRGVPRDDPRVLAGGDVPAVTGACMLVPADFLRELDGFDPVYRHYVEDVDLCLRAWAAGRRVVYEPRSVVYHLENASVVSTEWRDELVRAGWRTLHERWVGRWPADVVRLTWPAALPGGPRHLAVLAFGDELIERPELVRRFADRFGDRSDATLVIAVGSPEEGERLASVAELHPELDLLAVQLDAGLAASVAGVLSDREPPVPFAALERVA